MKYMVEIKRSARRTMSVEISHDGRVIVRAPRRLSEKRIYEFLDDRADWIAGHIEKIKRRNVRHDEVIQEIKSRFGNLTEADLPRIKKAARKDLTARVEKFAPLIGVTYGRISIRRQKTMWGSCSSNGNLNFNCLLMLAPDSIKDYVVIHELCHRLHMDHSREYWSEVARIIPDYRERRRWLAENGQILQDVLQS